MHMRGSLPDAQPRRRLAAGPDREQDDRQLGGEALGIGLQDLPVEILDHTTRLEQAAVPFHDLGVQLEEGREHADAVFAVDDVARPLLRMPRVELEDAGDGLDGELVKRVGLLEVAGIGISESSQDLAGSILVVDECSPTLESAEDGATADDVSDGFPRRVSLEARDCSRK